MALNFTNNVSDRVACGTGLVDHTQGVYWAWIYITAAGSASGRVMQCGLWGTGYRIWQLTGAGSPYNAYFSIRRATTDLQILCNAQLPNSTWLFVAINFNTGGANADQKMYVGTLTTPVAEASSYATQDVGSGAVQSNSGQTFYIGNSSAVNVNFNGIISTCGVISGRNLTLPEIKDLLYRPKCVANSKLLMHLGFMAAASIQPDWSGNGNNGTVVGATVAAHVPLGPPFGWSVGGPYIVTAAGVSIFPEMQTHQPRKERLEMVAY